MRPDWFSNVLPHAAAVILFALAALLFCHPVLEGKEPEQADLKTWKAASRLSLLQAEETGAWPLWNTNLFSGMPNYMTVLHLGNSFTTVAVWVQEALPQPVRYFFWAAVCFYVLGLAAGLAPPLAVFAALAYAYNTYHPVILHTGHITKMQALAWLPLWLAGVVRVWNSEYRSGALLCLLGATLQLGAFHLQITYYVVLLAGCISLSFAISAVAAGRYRHLLKALGILVGSGLLALAVQAGTILTARELAQTSIRGGSTVAIANDTVRPVYNRGLNSDYAFQYSFRKTEPLVVLLPDLFGGSSREPVPDESQVLAQLQRRGLTPAQARQVADQIPRYWGGLEATDGPPYLGALVVLLAILGFAGRTTPLLRALLAAVLLGVVLSWGRYLPGVSQWLLDHLPLYNKFRAPSMSITLLQAAVPLAAGLWLQQVAERQAAGSWGQPDFLRVRNVLAAVAGLLLVCLALFDYSAPIDALIMQTRFDASEVTLVNSAIVAGLRQDRTALFQQSLLRLLPFLLLLPALAWLLYKKWLAPRFGFLLLGIVTLADLFVMGWKYLPPEAYYDRDEKQAAELQLTETDRRILTDTIRPYRVFYAGPDRFNAEDYRVTAHHQAVGGYHAAKLRIYQDLLERYLRDTVNMPVLHMLNTRYIIHPTSSGDSLQHNENAFGPCWLVGSIKRAANDAEALQAVGRLPLREQAVVQGDVPPWLAATATDTAAFIHVVFYSNDRIRYTASCQSPRLAVFSEVFYPFGWKAYLNGKPVEIIRTNYVLRGVALPTGEHDLEFVFEPASYYTGKRIAGFAAWVLWALLLSLAAVPVYRKIKSHYGS
ncbi:MAG TPA: hypothetical protein PKE07_14770 [Lacibacter sp.]|nr:hypothetical protein [Lacibacter sp.]HMO90476.1 hypothetical protein [Lacibacter sp.]